MKIIVSCILKTEKGIIHDSDSLDELVNKTFPVIRFSAGRGVSQSEAGIVFPNVRNYISPPFVSGKCD